MTAYPNYRPRSDLSFLIRSDFLAVQSHRTRVVAYKLRIAIPSESFMDGWPTIRWATESNTPGSATDGSGFDSPYFFSVACQLVTTVRGGAVTSPPAESSIRNWLPSALG